MVLSMTGYGRAGALLHGRDIKGELRSVNQLGQRVSEIQRLGFRRCVVPAHRAGTIKAPTGLTVIPARNIGEAIRAALRPAE